MAKAYALWDLYNYDIDAQTTKSGSPGNYSTKPSHKRFYNQDNYILYIDITNSYKYISISRYFFCKQTAILDTLILKISVKKSPSVLGSATPLHLYILLRQSYVHID